MKSCTLKFDRRILSGATPSRFKLYAPDVGHLDPAPRPVREYENPVGSDTIAFFVPNRLDMASSMARFNGRLLF